VAVTANDNAGNSVTTNVRFTVTTSLRDIQNLVDRFRATSWLTLPAHTALTRELTRARTAEAKGNDAKALRHLTAFQALAADQSLVPRPDVRQVLTRDAAKMIEKIG
jgi:hypothetical protein